MSGVELVPRRMRADIPIDRLWLVFFCDGETSPWWARALAPGYRHVVACAWFADQQRWIYFNPARTGTVILLYREDEFGGRLTQLMRDSTLVLRVVATQSRRATPFGWWCTGAIKALMGIRTRALSPRSLARYLIAHGAEIVTIPAMPQRTFSEEIPNGKLCGMPEGAQ